MESLIGMVLMAVIGMGVVLVTSKVTKSQSEMQLQDIVVNTLRSALIKNGTDSFDVCTASLDFTLPNNETVTVTKQGCNTTTTATIGGTSVADIPQPIFLKATSATLGEIVVGGTWQ